MLKTGVVRTGKDVLGQPQLLDISQPLERGVINNVANYPIEYHVPVDFIADDERLTGDHFRSLPIAESALDPRHYARHKRESIGTKRKVPEGVCRTFLTPIFTKRRTRILRGRIGFVNPHPANPLFFGQNSLLSR